MSTELARINHALTMQSTIPHVYPLPSERTGTSSEIYLLGCIGIWQLGEGERMLISGGRSGLVEMRLTD